MDCPGLKQITTPNAYGTGEGKSRHFSLPGSNSWAQDTNLAIQRAVADALTQAALAMATTTPEPCAKSTTCTCEQAFGVMLGTPRISTEAGQSITFGPTGTVPLAPVTGSPSVGGGGTLSTGVITTIIIADIDWWLYAECFCERNKKKAPVGRASGTLATVAGITQYGGTCTVDFGGHQVQIPCDSPYIDGGAFKSYDGHLTGTALADAIAEVRTQAAQDMAAALMTLPTCPPVCPPKPPMMHMFTPDITNPTDEDGTYTTILVRWSDERICG
jgi:hypothetical protein